MKAIFSINHIFPLFPFPYILQPHQPHPLFLPFPPHQPQKTNQNITKGVKQVKQTDLNARFLFLAPPSLEILEKRLRGRATENEEGLRRRLDQARREMEFSQTPGAHDRIVVNDDLETAYRELRDFVFDGVGEKREGETDVGLS